MKQQRHPTYNLLVILIFCQSEAKSIIIIVVLTTVLLTGSKRALDKRQQQQLEFISPVNKSLGIKLIDVRETGYE